jgi:hypothetical protein
MGKDCKSLPPALKDGGANPGEQGIHFPIDSSQYASGYLEK